ncbi:hypothetical protein ASF51_12080 [Agreia sp. Leaf283]|nr:hypothetical protein ASF51_12080 [Agreia sp. Leaf283]
MRFIIRLHLSGPGARMSSARVVSHERDYLIGFVYQTFSSGIESDFHKIVRSEISNVEVVVTCLPVTIAAKPSFLNEQGHGLWSEAFELSEGWVHQKLVFD